ncbi:hypothetical protein NHQ30_001120 [Ciborinia camelliae]|nr:hypothetical protein NHQ30_001120 [Ciborinia camelliae]
MGIQNETAIGGHADHMNICRDIHNSKDDNLFETLCNKISKSTAPDPLCIDCLHKLLLLSSRIETPSLILPVSLESRWILSHKTYQDFIAELSGVLQLYGSPVSRLFVFPNFLPRFIAELSLSIETASDRQNLLQPTIINFSFDSSEQSSRCTSALFASLMHQLLKASPQYFKYVRHIYTRLESLDWGLEKLWILFQAMVLSPSVGQIYCIIIDIEKCDPGRNRFLMEFLELTQSKESKLKIIFTNGNGEMDKYPSTMSINVDHSEGLRNDIESFIEFEVSQLVLARPDFCSISANIRRKVLEVAEVDNNFYYINLVFKWLHHYKTRSTPFELEKVVSCIPTSCSNIYKALFSSSDTGLSWKLKAISWIAHAFRPLRIEELAIAIVMETPGGNFRINEENKPQDLLEDLKNTFGSFLNYQGDMVSIADELGRDLALQAVKDWDEIDWNTDEASIDDSTHHHSPLYGHARISSLCLDLLMSPTSKNINNAASNGEDDSLPGKPSDIFSYAARYWYVHYKSGGENQTLFDKVCCLIENENWRSIWKAAERIEGNKLACSRDPSNPLNITAQLGLKDTLLSMIQKRSYDQSELLAIAAERGDLNLIQQLEKQGITPPDLEPLRLAAENGHLGVVKDLLRIYTTTKSDLVDSALVSGLHAASQNGYEDVVEELLKNKMLNRKLDPDTLYLDGLTPMHHAAEFGHLKVCEKLVDAIEPDASSISKEDTGSTPLHLASLSGQINTMRFILDKGGNVNSKDKRSITPLHRAAKLGLSDALSLLISNKATIDVVDDDGNSPLHVAVSEGHVECVQTLLENGARVDICAKSVGNPLHIAARIGNEEIAIALIKARKPSVDLSSEDGNGDIPLHIAAKLGYSTLVKLLIEVDERLYRSPNSGEALERERDHEIGYLRRRILRQRQRIAAKPEVVEASERRARHDSTVLRQYAEDPALTPQTCLNPTLRYSILRTALNLAAESGSCDTVAVVLEYLKADGDDNSHDDDPSFALPLLSAALKGNPIMVQTLIKAGASPLCDSKAFEALYKASTAGDIGVINALFKAGLILSDDLTTHRTPLHAAVESKCLPVVKMLLEAQVDVNAPNAEDDGKTVLLRAAELGLEDMVETFLGAGAITTLVDDESNGFLHCATRGRKKSILDHALGNCETEVLLLNNENQTALHIAAETGFKEGVDAFLELEKSVSDQLIKAMTRKERTPLHLAARYGSKEIVESLLKAGSDINAVDQKGLTPFHLATKKEHVSVVKFLIQNEADPNILDAKEQSPLFKAFLKRNVELINLLQPVTKDLQKADAAGDTILHIASRRGMLEQVLDLISHELNIDAMNGEGRTPISIATEFNQLNTFQALLDRGANINYNDKRKHTVLSRAISSSNDTMVKALLDKGANPNLDGTHWPAVYTAAYWGSENLIKDFIQRGFDIEKRGAASLDWTPLHACYDNANVTEILLDKHANIHAVDEDILTPIDLSIIRGYWDVVKVYLEKGLDPLKGNSRNGGTPLHTAAKVEKWRQNPEGLKIMLNYAKGESFDIMDHDGHTPLRDAIDHQYLDMVETLISSSKCDLNQKDANGDGLLFLATETRNSALIDMLLKYSLTIDHNVVKRILRSFVQNPDLENIELQFAKGMKIDPFSSQDLFKATIENGNLTLIELLLKSGTDLEPPLDGEVLRMAARNEDLPLVELLLSRDGKHIEVESTDEHGWTAEMIARALQYMEIVEKLQTEKDDSRPLIKPSRPTGLGDVDKALKLDVDKSNLIVTNTEPLFFKGIIIGIGLASGDSPVDRMPGWSTKTSAVSWAYHGNSGHIHHDSYWGEEYRGGQRYKQEDIVGCLYDLDKQELSYTLNGEALGK